MGEIPVLDLWVCGITYSLPLLPGVLDPKLVVLVGILSIDLFEIIFKITINHIGS